MRLGFIQDVLLSVVGLVCSCGLWHKEMAPVVVVCCQGCCCVVHTAWRALAQHPGGIAPAVAASSGVHRSSRRDWVDECIVLEGQTVFALEIVPLRMGLCCLPL